MKHIEKIILHIGENGLTYFAISICKKRAILGQTDGFPFPNNYNIRSINSFLAD